MHDILDTILLLALPASGKSEVRRYLAHLPPEECQRDFHLGPTIQLDDFPYVHLMRRIDDGLSVIGKRRLFFDSPEKSFQDPRDWGTLIQLINQDHEDLFTGKVTDPESAASHLFERIDQASVKVGASERLSRLDAATRSALAEKLENEARALLQEKHRNHTESLDGRTLVIEFARGGPHGSRMPLPNPFGYRYSLGQLSGAILEKAAILYVWVTPEESRRKNQERTDPNDPGSILHHGVPLEVMLNDYGCDDLEWLEQRTRSPGKITVEAHGRTFHLPLARFDNRVDKTSFIRTAPSKWRLKEVQLLHGELKKALGRLFELARLSPAVGSGQR